MLAIAGVLAGAACRLADRPSEIDLLTSLPTATIRPGADVVRADIVSIADDARTALVMVAPARVTWSVTLPVRASLRTALALPGGVSGADSSSVRVGLSDGRSYRDVLKAEGTGTWTPIVIDLSDYSTWKFSLFDQPLKLTWQIIFNADAPAGTSLALERPVIGSVSR